MKTWKIPFEKRDLRWLICIIPVAATVTCIIAVITHMMLGVAFNLTDSLIYSVLSLIASIGICGFGYAGLFVASGFCLTGLVLGILFMAYVFTRPIKWAGIVGLVSGAELAFICFLIGICFEMLLYLHNKRRK